MVLTRDSVCFAVMIPRLRTAGADSRSVGSERRSVGAERRSDGPEKRSVGAEKRQSKGPVGLEKDPTCEQSTRKGKCGGRLELMSFGIAGRTARREGTGWQVVELPLLHCRARGGSKVGRHGKEASKYEAERSTPKVTKGLNKAPIKVGRLGKEVSDKGLRAERSNQKDKRGNSGRAGERASARKPGREKLCAATSGADGRYVVEILCVTTRWSARGNSRSAGKISRARGCYMRTTSAFQATGSDEVGGWRENASEKAIEKGLPGRAKEIEKVKPRRWGWANGSARRDYDVSKIGGSAPLDNSTRSTSSTISTNLENLENFNKFGKRVCHGGGDSERRLGRTAFGTAAQDGDSGRRLRTATQDDRLSRKKIDRLARRDRSTWGKVGSARKRVVGSKGETKHSKRSLDSGEGAAAVDKVSPQGWWPAWEKVTPQRQVIKLGGRLRKSLLPSVIKASRASGMRAGLQKDRRSARKKVSPEGRSLRSVHLKKASTVGHR
ncbi:hypothetical protein HDU88_003825 [Geranomyces variabilis]|nr:hypothetical protein HDU88_003825 [Geranomyces variabilis]